MVAEETAVLPSRTAKRGLLIRPAIADDAGTILALIRELALFEEALDSVENSEAAIRREGFGERPAFEVLIAEAKGTGAERETAGMALFYSTYSTWTGRRGLFIDDLFVRERFRSQGVGAALISEVARIAVLRGATRLDLQVLDWNSARRFYERLGLQHKSRWLPYRAEGEALATLASLAEAGEG